MNLRAADIHARLGSSWPAVLEQLGIAPQYLVNRHTSCPACGGTDRYRFDNKRGRGDYFCNGCGAGDGFRLLMQVYGWDFKTARDRVAEASGMAHVKEPVPVSAQVIAATSGTKSIAAPTQRVLRLRRQSCALVDCDEAVDYLASRRCWPPPVGCTLRAHPSVDYFEGAQRIGRHAALVAEVRDIAGELVSLHVTYLEQSRKLGSHEPRKLLSPLTGHTGCAVRLVPVTTDTLGIAEGIETALAAYRVHEVPVWSALNATLLAKFEPPPDIKRLLIFADRDSAGLEAAARLAERLQGRIAFEIKLPPPPHKDWNDHLETAKL